MELQPSLESTKTVGTRLHPLPISAHLGSFRMLELV